MKNKKIIDYIAKVAIFSALSFILYLFPKFPLPIFPSFLDIQFSNLPAILGGFVLGPLGGCIIVIVRCALKLLLGIKPDHSKKLQINIMRTLSRTDKILSVLNKSNAAMFDLTYKINESKTWFKPIIPNSLSCSEL